MPRYGLIIWSQKYLALNRVFHGRMKHVEVDYHFIRERVARGLLEVDYIPTGVIKSLMDSRRFAL
jgi:hypothetical protein